MTRLTAKEILSQGDQVHTQCKAGATYPQAAEVLGLTLDQAKKAARLAKVFSADQRRAIGEDALTVLTPAHLEAVAGHPSALMRVDLLLGASREGTSSRTLRDAVNNLQHNQPVRGQRITRNYRDSPKLDFDVTADAASALLRQSDQGLRQYMGGQKGEALLRLCQVMKDLNDRIGLLD